MPLYDNEQRVCFKFVSFFLLFAWAMCCMEFRFAQTCSIIHCLLVFSKFQLVWRCVARHADDCAKNVWILQRTSTTDLLPRKFITFFHHFLYRSEWLWFLFLLFSSENQLLVKQRVMIKICRSIGWIQF